MPLFVDLKTKSRENFYYDSSLHYLACYCNYWPSIGSSTGLFQCARL